ncbi:hypothetical protein K438DRAFT_2016359 [Mycena galopus ATCC 62051]|nr:hypothetical protein K438DRAFT_2027447 [Mycena galopus ATCC 62051]KAF8198287.1 hypothetical protein K438DRAFT_2016359 [Mycena galopus ATCC 62051]
MAERPPPTDPQPWRPFRSQLDFELAEFCEHNMLNQNSTDTLISLIRRCMLDPDNFTLRSQNEVAELWNLASHKCTAFEKGSVTVQYKKQDKTFDTYVRPLWDLTLSLVQDPRLASCFVWDAEKAYKFNGDSYVRFYHEPWTADAFWDAQSGLPDDPAAKPVCWIIYADKSKLSSFGTQKAYSVVARLGNIRADVRNSTRFGGGQIVGHQPIVDDDPKERNKPAFSNFKNIVWHAAMYKLLETIAGISKVGHWTQCGDDLLRWLFPLVLILAADYEEACVMALIRGLQGLYPCPICFVPWDQQSDLSTEHPLRSSAESQQILEVARAKSTKEEREEHLKDHGLRDIDNVFWKIRGSDPYKAISYDPLHADDGGFWGDHLFPLFKARVEELGRPAIVKIDSQMAAFPRWRSLNHFETVMNTSFNDGSKHEDIAKMMLFVGYNVLDNDAGVVLLQALRSYLEFRTALSAEVHTTETIAVGSGEVNILGSLIKKYIVLCEGTDYENKNWNFPKMHARRHAFDHIKSKGAVRNFNTKASESMHGPIRQTYHRMTNFKDVTAQLVKHDHRRTVATFIREQIDALNEDTDAAIPDDLETSSNVDIGSKLPPVTFSALEESMSQNPAFERFRIKFGDFISDFLPAFGYALPNGKRLSFDKDITITPFQFLKVHYESLSTWTSATDYLKCNAKFNGRPRYDCVMVKTEDKPFFARLLYLFSCTVEKQSHHFALILPMDAPTGRSSRIDKALRFLRVKSKPEKQSEFISVHSIIRGVVLVPDSDKPGEFVVFDVLDPDTSRRLNSLYPRDHKEY